VETLGAGERDWKKHTQKHDKEAWKAFKEARDAAACGKSQIFSPFGFECRSKKVLGDHWIGAPASFL
jgi:hypothetical protein